jgi:2-haloalkanoic acid dehalogenase type II
LTALLDSWTLWESVAGGAERGLLWRRAYLDLTYGTGAYRPYEELVREAAVQVGFPAGFAPQLAARWDELQPWPGVPETLAELRGRYQLAVVTNCSETLGRRAAALLGGFDVVVTSERAGFYKPHARPYQMALEELAVPAAETLFVAGSAFDIPGASSVGMPVYWHNHIGLAARPGPQALAESREFPALLRWLNGA